MRTSLHKNSAYRASFLSTSNFSYIFISVLTGPLITRDLHRNCGQVTAGPTITI